MGMFFDPFITATNDPLRPSLYLDPQIRDWVLFPITLVMVRLPKVVQIPPHLFRS